MSWTSNALWAAGVYCNGDVTTDTHDTKEQAEAVCNLLHKNGFGGDGKHYPLRTWVKEVRPASDISPEAREAAELAQSLFWRLHLTEAQREIVQHEVGKLATRALDAQTEELARLREEVNQRWDESTQDYYRNLEAVYGRARVYIEARPAEPLDEAAKRVNARIATLEQQARETDRLSRGLERIGFFFAGDETHHRISQVCLKLLSGSTIEQALAATTATNEGGLEG